MWQGWMVREITHPTFAGRKTRELAKVTIMACQSVLGPSLQPYPTSSPIACTRLFRSPSACCTARWRATRLMGWNTAARIVM